MLSVKENERLTRVGPGTPMGELMRRYWHPIAATAELEQEPTKAVKLLGESLVLYKDRSGALGLIGAACPHRRVNMLYGIPEQDGLRCPYHGWLFNEMGRCLEMPAEAPDSTFPQRVTTPAYPVQELGGLIFAYLGPQPVPLLPRWGPLVWENSVRDIALSVLPCNWLQCQENSLDPIHVEWLHFQYSNYLAERQGRSLPTLQGVRRHKKIGFDVFEYGVIKRRVMEGQTEDDPDWRVGHPILFPNILLVGRADQGTLQFRVPMDDTHTFHASYYAWRGAPGFQAPRQESVPYRHVPLQDDQGQFIVDFVFNQDYMAWITQGDIADRSVEKLGESDKGIILYRRLLREQLEKVAEGVDPMNVFRDPAKNQCIEPPLEPIKFGVKRDKYVPLEAGETSAVPAIQRVIASHG